MPDTTQNIWANHFLGTQTIQCWDDLYIWERILNTHPEMQHVIEVGTGSGGLSMYLALQCYARGILFSTYDFLYIPTFVTHPVAKLLNLHNRQVDCFAERHSVADLLRASAHPLVLLCDGGNKPKEFQTFVPMLQPGDIVAVHDWMNEFGPDDAKSVAHLVQMIEEPLCEELHAMTRWYGRV
jgi:hypothetical protein